MSYAESENATVLEKGWLMLMLVLRIRRLLDKRRTVHRKPSGLQQIRVLVAQ